MTFNLNPKNDILFKTIDFGDVKETKNYLNLSNQYYLGRVANRPVTKIEELNCNQKLVVSSYGNLIKTGWFNFDPIESLDDYVYFILNKKKDIILACNRHKICLYSIESKSYYPFYFDSRINDVAMIEDHFFLFAFEKQKYITIYVWNNFLSNIKNRAKYLIGHRDDVNRLCTVDNDHFLSGSNDSTIKYWKISELECIRTFVGHRGMITCLTLLSNPKTFASGSTDMTLKIWDLESGLCLKTFKGHEDYLGDIQETKMEK
ncbi:unnamed protein product [Brachionus calyciflorus]|uniref:Uncharacterized protein n=1 Tax=Brachionus calyciflorus TaxID=104777 RepID=A0A813TTU9_9BILA|nr:unnamed protein product [Brachionus calyciflorus]